MHCYLDESILLEGLSGNTSTTTKVKEMNHVYYESQYLEYIESSGNTNLALAVFGCLWESLIVFANDWVHFGV